MNVYLRILQILFCCVFHFTFIWAAAAASDGCCCNLEWSWLWRHAVSLLNSCGKSPQFFLSYTVLVVTPPSIFCTLSWYWAFTIVVLLLFTNLTGFFIVDFFLLYGYMIIMVYFSKCVLEMDHQCKSRKIYEQIISHSEIFTFTAEYVFNMSNSTDRH